MQTTFFSKLLGRTNSPKTQAALKGELDQGDLTVRYRMGLPMDVRRLHAAGTKQMRALLDACRIRDMRQAIACLRRFAETHRELGLFRSVLLCPYLRWAISKDRAASQQLDSVCGDLARSALLIEAVMVRYLESPWDDERHRSFVHEIASLAHLYAQSIRIEASHLLPIYLPPEQYQLVVSTASPVDG